jgi:hypothetical protein
LSSVIGTAAQYPSSFEYPQGAPDRTSLPAVFPAQLSPVIQTAAKQQHIAFFIIFSSYIII